jgi:hypothetical protein
MTAYERDYIGSADAYRVFSGRYRALIESKADDTGFMDARMSRGLTLEHDIVLEAIDGFRCPTLFQERFTHPDPARHYCKATCDGVGLEGDVRTVIEA